MALWRLVERAARWAGWVGVLVGVGCGSPDAGDGQVQAVGSSRAGIINGSPGSEDEYKTAGAVLLATSKNGGIWCSGTLIAPDVVLTAAHCIMHYDDANRAYVNVSERFNLYFSFSPDVSTFGSTFPTPPARSIKVRAKGGVAHEDFTKSPCDEPRTQQTIDACQSLAACLQGTDATQVRDCVYALPRPVKNALGLEGLSNHADIGLLYLEEAVTDVRPARVLAPDDAGVLTQGTEVAMVGYGTRSTDPHEDAAGLKMQASTVINEVGEHELQVGTALPDPQKCYGDSGGPTYLRVGEGEDGLRVAGVTSRDYDLVSGCDIGSIDMRPDAFYDWIDGRMKTACRAGLRVACEGEGGLADALTKKKKDDGCAALPAGPTGLGLGLLALRRLRRRRR